MSPEPLSLTHLVREPLVNAPGAPPLLLLLHGVGSNEQDLVSLAPYVDERFLVIAARAPLTLRAGSYAWYHVTFGPEGPVYDPAEPEASRKALIHFISEAVDAYGVDPRRVFVGGFSQGGAMTYSLAVTVPELLAGAVIMSGRTIPEMAERMAPTEKLDGLPVLVVHGTRDTVLPLSFGHALREQLSALPVALTYREFDMAHEINSESLEVVLDWLKDRLNEK
jgi:phospholipase/carboxylesterase